MTGRFLTEPVNVNSFLSMSMPISTWQWQSQFFSQSYTAILRVIAGSCCGTDGSNIFGNGEREMPWQILF